MVRLEEDVRAVNRMELQGLEDKEVVRLERKGRVPSGWSFRISRKLKRFDWKGKQEFPSGWSFKISRRLKRFDWKERQELPPGWSFKISRRLKRSDWKKGKSFL